MVKSLIITHNAGFFSCCSVRLHHIVRFINDFKKLPNSVDSSKQFEWYKQNKNDADITFDCLKIMTRFLKKLKESAEF